MIPMKNKFKKIIITTVSVFSISMLPLPGTAAPAPCPTEPFESESSEEPGGENSCAPLNDMPGQECPKI